VSDYLEFRGKCKEMAEDAVRADLSLRLVRGFYVEFDGNVECEFCQKIVPEADVYRYAQHAYCSYECYGHDVGF